MTPLELEILLHYHSHANDYRDGDFSAPAVRETIENFVKQEGMLCALMVSGFNNKCYTLTERGRVFVDALCKLPLPQQIWVMPRETA